MRFFGVAVLAMALAASSAQAQTYTPGQAANAGKSDGVASNPTTAGNINTATGTATVPNYNTNPPEGAYFGGGNGNVAAPTATKLSSCTMASTAECTAINLMQYKASNANPVTINPLDPLVVNSKSVTKTPAPTLGVTAGIFTAPPTTSACAAPTTTTGTGSQIEYCEAHGTPTSMSCVKPWDFQIDPWWAYHCEKSNVTVSEMTCTKDRVVTVQLIENCTIGSVVANADIPWGYWYLSGNDLYVEGGYAKAMCNPALANEVQINIAALNVVQGGAGSQCCFAPGPNRSLIGPTDFMNVPTTVSTSFFKAGNPGVTFGWGVFAGSGCNAQTGDCTYNGFIGSPLWGCPNSATLHWTYSDYYGTYSGTGNQSGDAFTGYLQSAYCDGDFKGYGSVTYDYYAGAIVDCSMVPGAAYGYDLGNGSAACYSAGPSPVVVGLGNDGTYGPAKAWTLNFQKPRLVPTLTDEQIISTCGALESSPTCTNIGSQCLQGAGETRMINGLAVTRDCWRYGLTFECTSAAGPNYCAPLTAEPLCAQTGVDECMAYSQGGQCVSYMADYRCTKDMGPPPNVTLTATGYTVVKDALNDTACTSLATNPNCTKTGSVCTDTADKTFFGFTFSKTCWSYTDTYTCPGSSTSDCQQLVNNGCSVIPSKTTCISHLPDGSCDTTAYYYECGTPVTVTPTGGTCDNTPYCINGICYDTARPADPDFGKAVAFQEAAREAGNYIDPATFEIFKGEANFCRKRSLVNCCKGNGAQAPSLTNRAIYTAVDFGRTYAGSMYMYDTLFASGAPDFLVNGLESLGVTSAVGANTFSAYGVTIGWGAEGFEIVAFDPYTFIAQVIIYIVISELMSCEDYEKVTAVKKDQGICQDMGSWCSNKILGMCESRTVAYCCFNSKLAKAVNMQGKTQLGIPWGPPQDPNCRGLTIDQINSLDFSTIDLSEFIASIAANAIGNADAVTNAVNRLVNPNTSSIPVPMPNGGGYTEGPASLPPPPPPPVVNDPVMTASVSPASVTVGGTLSITTTAANATSATFSCTGATVATGSIPTSTTTTTITAAVANVGITNCQYTATGQYGSDTVQIQYTITPPAPQVTATFVPATVAGGSPFSLNTVTVNSTSLDYICTGANPMSGTLGTGSVSTPLVASTTNMGVTNCTFNARDAGGNVGTSTASYTVNPVIPTITASFFPTPVAAGGAYQLNVVSTNAASVTYSCVGGLAGSGTVPTGSYTEPRTATLAQAGTSTCTYTAHSVTGNVVNKAATVTITP